ncbi:uncharacterized protein DS421_4g123420 [Arachis hypogaea]|nr:uncharacterized protein DS421_4g123420 [Arachis hypogaea]
MKNLDLQLELPSLEPTDLDAGTRSLNDHNPNKEEEAEAEVKAIALNLSRPHYAAVVSEARAVAASRTVPLQRENVNRDGMTTVEDGVTTMKDKDRQTHGFYCVFSVVTNPPPLMAAVFGIMNVRFEV